jgi:hypothetical protein
MKKSLINAFAISAPMIFVVAGAVEASESKGYNVSNPKVWVCSGAGEPVCGRRSGKTQNYPSACAASNDAAVIVGRGACGPRPQGGPVPWPWPW